MRKILTTLSILIICTGLAAMCGSDCPTLTSEQQIINMTKGALLFFGGAGLLSVFLKRLQ